MVDITSSWGVLSWFINQLITGGASHCMIYARFDVATPVQAVVEANVPRMGDLHDLHAKL